MIWGFLGAEEGGHGFQTFYKILKCMYGGRWLLQFLDLKTRRSQNNHLHNCIIQTAGQIGLITMDN